VPTKEIEALARTIARPDTKPAVVEFARQVAQARLDLARVRCARKVILLEVLCPQGQDGSEAQLDAAEPEAVRAFADRLMGRMKTLRALDRYERAALARRRFANYALDDARLHHADPAVRQASRKVINRSSARGAGRRQPPT
jgi:hypothetical protein